MTIKFNVGDLAYIRPGAGGFGIGRITRLYPDGSVWVMFDISDHGQGRAIHPSRLMLVTDDHDSYLKALLKPNMPARVMVALDTALDYSAAMGKSLDIQDIAQEAQTILREHRTLIDRIVTTESRQATEATS